MNFSPRYVKAVAGEQLYSALSPFPADSLLHNKPNLKLEVIFPLFEIGGSGSTEDLVDLLSISELVRERKRWNMDQELLTSKLNVPCKIPQLSLTL
jgi:hypothetical protein